MKIINRLSLNSFAYLVFCLLVLNLISTYSEAMQIAWSNPWVILILSGLVMYVNTKLFPLGALCWPNIFLFLLIVFHLGYYIPARFSLVDELIYMPNMDDPDIPMALTIFATAFFSFELGALYSLSLAIKKRTLPHPISSNQRDFKAILYLGIFVTLLSSILFIFFIYQLGNFSEILKLNYSDYVSFLSYSDSRFVATSINFLPVGLLLSYIGLRGSSNYKKQRYTSLVVSGLILFSFWLLWVGNRGTAMLSLIAILYLSHLRRVKRIPYWQVALIVLVGSLTIGMVKQFRNVPISLRSDLYFRINPLDGLVELGGIFLPYHGFIKLFSSEMVSRMGINPYLIAITRLVPNLGTISKPIEYTEYFRSNIWITQILAPQDSSVGIGLGSSGIGEPYACFGYFGVVLLFLVIAFFIVKLEMSSLLFSSAYTSGLIAFLFIPMNWYIRDDIFGTLRPVAWGFIAVFITAFLAGRKRRAGHR